MWLRASAWSEFSRGFVIGAFYTDGDALAGLKEARRRHDGDLQLVNLSRFERLARFVRLNRRPGFAVVAQLALRGAEPTAGQLVLFTLPVDQQQCHEQQARRYPWLRRTAS